MPAGARLLFTNGQVGTRDRVLGAHKPGATLIVVAGLARPELKIEIEAVAAKVD